ncbi:MAG TPA: methionyl-tRNA formyltransferase [Bacteroidales bacterium]|nr:methionyl-tRNA formyltransferase [Bacteroidales bacterium]
MNNSGTRIIFMGTPEFATGTLKTLIDENYVIAGVVTAPDKPAGRGKKISESAVKVFTRENIPESPILQPEKLKDPEFIAELHSLNGDLFVVVAFRMLPEAVWSIPRLGTINLHASLLPQYRGAAPINWCLVNGETETGVTTFLIDHEIDTGKILMQEKVGIHPEDNAGTLHDKLMHAGADLVVKTVANLEKDDITPIKQDVISANDSDLKKAPKITREDCRINWNSNVDSINNLIRGMTPFPGAFSKLRDTDGKSLMVKILKSAPASINSKKQPGSIESDNKTFLQVHTSNGVLDILTLQLEGKKRMAIGDFLRGFNNDLNHLQFD